MNGRRILLAGIAVTGVACSDMSGPTGSDLPVAVSWMEWQSAVTADQHGSIRIVGYHGACGTFRLDVTQSGPSSVGVNASEHFDIGSPILCPALAIIFDSTVPLPRLVSPTGPSATFTVDAPVFDPVGGITRRAFGYVLLAEGQPDATLQVGGSALVLPDSLGCSWARAQLPPNAPAHVLAVNLTIGGTVWRSAFVSGYFQPMFVSRCGQNPLLVLRVIEVDGP